MRRIFFEISLSKIFQEKVRTWQGSHPELPVHWVSGGNFHITLVPPWGEGNIITIIDRLQKVHSLPFWIDFHVIDFGTMPHKPRLIWAKGNAPLPLLQLKKEIEKVLDRDTNNNNFLLHTTLARFNPQEFKK